MRGIYRGLLALAVLLFSLPAAAVPIVYGASGVSTITVQARQSSDSQLVFDETLALSTDSFITWDTNGAPQAGTGGTIDDLLLHVIPGQGPFSTLIPYGPFDEITIDSASIKPDLGVGYGTLFSFGGPTAYSLQVGSVEIDAFYSASNSVTHATSGSVAADITGGTNPLGTVTLGPGSIQVEFTSIVMGTVDGTPFNEAGNDLLLTANIAFFGDSNVTPTPEPSTGLLVMLGLVGLAARRRPGAVHR